MSLMSLNRKLVSGEVRKLLFGAVKRGREKIMASRVEVLFIDEGDSVNKGNGFILNFLSIGSEIPQWLSGEVRKLLFSTRTVNDIDVI